MTKRSTSDGFSAVKLWVSARVGLRRIRAEKIRSTLTMLGVVIGVASVIAVMAFGKGAQIEILARIQSLGANLFILAPGSSTQRGADLEANVPLTIEDAIAIEREVPFVAAVAPVKRGQGRAIRGNRNLQTIFQGVTRDYLVAREWPIVAGRSFSPDEIKSAAKVAILGHTVASKLFGTEDAVGQMIRMNSTPAMVVGVLEKKGPSARGRDQDNRILVPLTTAQIRILGSSTSRARNLDFIMVKAREPKFMDQVETEIRSLLRQRHELEPSDADDFNLRNMAELQATREQASETMTRLLLAVASVALIVGGISIMNMMLVSVTERTREIGLRRAVGAGKKDILSQFLVEATTLSMMGGVLGIIVGVLGSVVVAAVTKWPISIDVATILLGFGAASFVGVFFGFYPALRAARLDPIIALRYE